jgi:hypothetical protein
MTCVLFDSPRVTQQPNARAAASAPIRLGGPRHAAASVVFLALVATLQMEVSGMPENLAANRIVHGLPSTGPVPDAPAPVVNVPAWNPPFAWNGDPAHRAAAPSRDRKEEKREG